MILGDLHLPHHVGSPVRLPLTPRGGGPLQPPPPRLERFRYAAVLQREDLEPTAVGDERTVPPAREFVYPPRVADDVGSRLEHEVVRVREDQLLPRCVGGGEIRGLQRPVRSDGHESGRVDDAVRRMHPSHARRAHRRSVQYLEAEVFFGSVGPGREVRRGREGPSSRGRGTIAIARRRRRRRGGGRERPDNGLPPAAHAHRKDAVTELRRHHRW